MTTSPWAGFSELEESETIPAPVVVEMGRRIEAGANLFPVEDKDENDPPGTCADGASYIIAATATGAWAGHEKKIATAVGANASNGWLIRAVSEGVYADVRDENALYRYDGSAWVLFSAGSSTLNLDPEWTLNFTDDGDVYIAAVEEMTIDEGNAPIGTATLAYEKSTSATPGTFSSTSLPATLQAGAWLKVSATGVSGFSAVHLVRTA